MTVRERIFSNRLIQKIDNAPDYAQRIGLSYTITKPKARKEISQDTKPYKANH